MYIQILPSIQPDALVSIIDILRLIMYVILYFTASLFQVWWLLDTKFIVLLNAFRKSWLNKKMPLEFVCCVYSMTFFLVALFVEWLGYYKHISLFIHSEKNMKVKPAGYCAPCQLLHSGVYACRTGVVFCI